jgi:hypothetical protein
MSDSVACECACSQAAERTQASRSHDTDVVSRLAPAGSNGAAACESLFGLRTVGLIRLMSTYPLCSIAAALARVVEPGTR